MLVTPALTAVFCIGWASLICLRYVKAWPTFDAAKKAAFNPLDTNFNVLVIGVLFFGVLGALVVTNEYGNGVIRATLAATPQRGLILAAKTALLILVALPLSAVIIFCGVPRRPGHPRRPPPARDARRSGRARPRPRRDLLPDGASLIGVFPASWPAARRWRCRRGRRLPGARDAGRQPPAQRRVAAYGAVYPVEPGRRAVALAHRDNVAREPGRRGGRLAAWVSSSARARPARCACGMRDALSTCVCAPW